MSKMDIFCTFFPVPLVSDVPISSACATTKKFFLSNKLSFFFHGQSKHKTRENGQPSDRKQLARCYNQTDIPDPRWTVQFLGIGQLARTTCPARRCDTRAFRQTRQSKLSKFRSTSKPGPEHLERRARQLISASTINRSALQSARVNVRTILSARPQPKPFSSNKTQINHKVGIRTFAFD